MSLTVAVGLLMFGLCITAIGIRQARKPQDTQFRQASPVDELRAEAEKGSAHAQFRLGCQFYRDEVNLAEAAKWFRKAAEQGYESAQFNLGLMYSQGRGVTKDQVEAVKWLRKAAPRNYEAQRVLVDLYREAAERGDATGQYNLGNCYRQGHGVKVDYVEAVKWLGKAAEQHNTSAQLILSACYFTGQGVEKDEAEAYKWLLLASAQGDQNAGKWVRDLAGKMTPEKVAEGKKLAHAFEARNARSEGK